MNENEIKMYTVKDVQSLFRCGRDKAYAIMKTKGFPSVRFGSQYLVEKSALEYWLTKQQGRQIII